MYDSPEQRHADKLWMDSYQAKRNEALQNIEKVKDQIITLAMIYPKEEARKILIEWATTLENSYMFLAGKT